MPFLALFHKFFGGELYFLTDEMDSRDMPDWTHTYLAQGTWCQMLEQFANSCPEPLLLLQDDFFIHAVRHHLIERAADLVSQGAACVRVYPCPGAEPSSNGHQFGRVAKGADYRISCQAAVWNPQYLAKIAHHAKGSAADFELIGTPYSGTLPEPVLAFKRECQPWPIEYLCTAIVRGLWLHDAKKLCDQFGIETDWSMRPFATA